LVGYVLMLVVLLTAPIGNSHRSRGYLNETPSRVTQRVVNDSLINLAMFAPLGWGLRGLIGQRLNVVVAVAAVTVIGGLFSVSMETLQYFLPRRYSSIFDVVFNTIGTVIGSLVAQLRR
jgi:glycopeptide antibiotics resistance protein